MRPIEVLNYQKNHQTPKRHKKPKKANFRPRPSLISFVMLAHSFDPVLLHAIHAPVESIKPVPARSLSLSGVLHAEKDQKMSEVRFCRSIERFCSCGLPACARALRRLCRDKSSMARLVHYTTPSVACGMRRCSRSCQSKSCQNPESIPSTFSISALFRSFRSATPRKSANGIPLAS